MLKQMFCIALFFCLTTLVYSSILTPNIEKSIQSAKNDQEALKLVHDYISQTDDIEDLRIIQNYWLKLAPEECKTFFLTLKDKNRKDMRYLYLWARSTENSKTQIEIGRKLIKKFSGFEYGYRLLLTTYQKQLFNTPDSKHPTAQPWIRDFKRDRKYFDQYLLLFPNDENAIYLKLSLLVWEKNVSEANRLLSIAVSLEASWLTWQFYTDYYLRTNQLLMLQTYIRRMIEISETTKQLTSADKEYRFEQTYLGILMLGEAYPAFISYIKEHPKAINNTQVKQMLLVVYTKQGDTNLAFDLIDQMLISPNDYYIWLVTEGEISPLKDDPRWNIKIAEFKRYWDLNSNQRKSTVLAKKINKPAPKWELYDVYGNLIKLEDMKGSIVILDFWATWCNPCKEAMPVLSDWMKSNMPGGVKVFSINIWERDTSGVAPFMTDNKYAMTLLYGTNDLAKKYGVTAIPYLCVIDKDGNIRYEETGYSPELSENLGFWVEDLH